MPFPQDGKEVAVKFEDSSARALQLEHEVFSSIALVVKRVIFRTLDSDLASRALGRPYCLSDAILASRSMLQEHVVELSRHVDLIYPCGTRWCCQFHFNLHFRQYNCMVIELLGRSLEDRVHTCKVNIRRTENDPMLTQLTATRQLRILCCRVLEMPAQMTQCTEMDRFHACTLLEKHFQNPPLWGSSHSVLQKYQCLKVESRVQAKKLCQAGKP
eukprot:3547109-Amphidinium_carterae.1